MDPFGLNPESVIARVRASGAVAPIPTHSRSMLLGALGFSVASLIVFGTVAFAERWMYQNLGLTGAYITWTVLFMIVAGGLLSSLIIGPGRLGRFYALFCLAFLLYAVGWIAAYFTLGGLPGEWAGSLLGSILMAVAICWAFGSFARFPGMALILFVGNSLGYFAGSFLNSYFGDAAGMLLWGLFFGLGLGFALGWALYDAQGALRTLLQDPFKTRA
ncbi:MAG: hypothetical protein ABI882_11115 [Acidobacteriota bacterium]